MKRLVFAVALAGCGPRTVPVEHCDQAQRERVFLACLASAQHMGGGSTPGNDSDEVVDSCSSAAGRIACVTVREVTP